MRSRHIPVLPLAVRGEDECALLRAHENPYAAHVWLLGPCAGRSILRGWATKPSAARGPGKAPTPWSAHAGLESWLDVRHWVEGPMRKDAVTRATLALLR